MRLHPELREPALPGALGDPFGIGNPAHPPIGGVTGPGLQCAEDHRGDTFVLVGLWPPRPSVVVPPLHAQFQEAAALLADSRQWDSEALGVRTFLGPPLDAGQDDVGSQHHAAQHGRRTRPPENCSRRSSPSAVVASLRQRGIAVTVLDEKLPRIAADLRERPSARQAPHGGCQVIPSDRPHASDLKRAEGCPS